MSSNDKLQVLGTGLAILVIDRIGRKVLLLASGASMCITIFALGTYFYLDEQNKSVDSLSWLPLVIILLVCILMKILVK